MIEPSDFFLVHKKFLKIIASDTSDAALLKWSSYIESRLRHLVVLVEQVNGVQYSIPWHESFVVPKKKEEGEADESDAKNDTVYFISLHIDMQNQPGDKEKTLDLSDPVKEWKIYVEGWVEKSPTSTVGVEYIDVRKMKDFSFPNGQKPLVRNSTRKRKRNRTRGTEACKSELKEGKETAKQAQKEEVKIQDTKKTNPAESEHQSEKIADASSESQNSIHQTTHNEVNEDRFVEHNSNPIHPNKTEVQVEDTVKFEDSNSQKQNDQESLRLSSHLQGATLSSPHKVEGVLNDFELFDDNGDIQSQDSQRQVKKISISLKN